MSIHSIAKETGISEYALKKYAKNHNLPRKNDNSCRRNGYVFTKKDIEFIKQNYVRYDQNLQVYNEYIWIFYKKILSDGVTRIQTPVGRFNSKYSDVIEEFIKLQSYKSPYGKNANHFCLVNEHTALLRLKKILNLPKNISREELESIENLIVPLLPVTADIIKNSILTKEKIDLDNNLISEYKINIQSLSDLQEYN